MHLKSVPICESAPIKSLTVHRCRQNSVIIQPPLFQTAEHHPLQAPFSSDDNAAIFCKTDCTCKKMKWVALTQIVSTMWEMVLNLQQKTFLAHQANSNFLQFEKVLNKIWNFKALWNFAGWEAAIPRQPAHNLYYVYTVHYTYNRCAQCITIQACSQCLLDANTNKQTNTKESRAHRKFNVGQGKSFQMVRPARRWQRQPKIRFLFLCCIALFGFALFCNALF